MDSMSEANKYFYLKNKLTGEVLVSSGYMVLFPSIEEAFAYKEKFLDQGWRVVQCSNHLSDQ